jgi:predicted permease
MRIFRRLAHWWRFGENGAELAEEMQFHRDEIERDLIARGHSPADARAAAHRAMGNETFGREESRGVWLWPWLDAVWQDARCFLRGLRRTPGFAAGVMLTFALGIGANGAMFSVVDRLMFRPPPLMRDPGTAHRVYLYRVVQGVESQAGLPYGRYADLARLSTAFSDFSAYTAQPLAISVGDAAEVVRVAAVSAKFFAFFDAPPARGRYFTSAEDSLPAGTPVAVISHDAWLRRYAANPDVIGQTVQIGPTVFTIIGIAPPGFAGLWPDQPPVAYIPVSTYAASRSGANWATTFTSQVGIGTIVRRKAGVSIDAATADLSNAFTRSFQAQLDLSPGSNPLSSYRPRAVAGSILAERGPEPSSVSRVATWLAGVTLIVLLIACANVANLLLARAISRRREIAVRIALGVSKQRLLSQLFTESMVLAALGGVAGLLVAVFGSRALRTVFFPGTERMPIIGDSRTLAFMAIIVVCVGLVSGLFPLLQARHLTITDDLKTGAREGGQLRSRARVTLLVLQGALSVVLLVGAGLFVRSLGNVRHVRLGFDADSILLVRINMRGVPVDSARMTQLRLQLLSAASEVSGVSHASLQESVPFRGSSSWPIYVEGIDSTNKFGVFEANAVSPGFFATMGTRILRGRGFENGDVDGATRVIVVGAAMGQRLWPGQDPIGKCVRIDADTVPCRYVVGVAEDTHAHKLSTESRLFYYYLPAAQWRPHDGGLFVRTRGDVRRMVEPLRQRLQREMPGMSYVTVLAFAEVMSAEMRSWSMGATLFTAFGVLALVLAAVGLYSVLAYDVAQRRREFAVRVALGAAMRDVMRLVVAGGLRYAVYGVVVGGAVAWLAGRWIAPLLFNQSPRDPAVFGTVTGALLVVALAASLLPAIRGARADPNAVLRAE